MGADCLRAALALPMRDGVSASTMVLPVRTQLHCVPDTLLSFLEHQANIPRGLNWVERFKAGLVCDARGSALAMDAPYLPGQRIYYWRDAGVEPRIPFDEHIIYQDEHILVADKPHFLPVTPSGPYVQETLLVRLKKRTGLADLTPMHRIDRDTAGLVMFCIHARERDAYAAMFRDRRVGKTYECIAAQSAHLQFPLTRTTRLMTSPSSFMQMSEVPGPANAQTHIELVETVGERLARYRLRPLTGKRHQLRVHMNALGLPIVGDGIYPHLTPYTPQPDYSRALQLIAMALCFDDPLSKRRHEFQSRHRLSPGSAVAASLHAQ